MTCLPGALVGAPIAADSAAAPPSLEGIGFILRPQDTKVYLPSQAPVVFYDILDDRGARIGQAHLIREPDAAKVAEVGHLCAQLAQARNGAPLLGHVARALINHAFALEVPVVRLVIPTRDAVSLEACARAGGRRTGEIKIDGEPHTTFEVSRSE